MNKLIYRVCSLMIVAGMILGGVHTALASAESDAQLTEHQSALLTATTYYVSTTGSDTNPGTATAPFKTFAKAASVLTAGSTLQVAAGTYHETLAIANSGTASAPITVIGNGALLDMQSANQYGIKITGSYINISKFEVTKATGFGIYVAGKYDIVDSNIVHDNVTENGIGTCGIASSWGSALKIKVGADHVIVRNNKVYNNCGEGIAITRGVSTLVENNTAYDNYSVNIYIDNSPYTTVQNNLSYCLGTHLKNGNRPSGISLGEELYSGWGAQLHDVMVAGNTIKDCRIGVNAFKSEVNGILTNVTITKNYVPTGQSRGINVGTLGNLNVLISYNTVFNDISVSPTAGVTLIGNIIGSSTAPTATKVAVATNTPIAVTSTPIFTSTPSTTITKTPAPTNTPGSTTSGPDAIFANGFESGNFSGWTSTNGANLSVNPNAALAGSYGMQVAINGTTGIYVRDDSPAAEFRYRARFYFNPNSISMATGDYTYPLEGRDTANNIVLRVQFKRSSTGYQLAARAYDSVLANWVSTPLVNISNAMHVVELDWGNDGHLNFWVDGAQQGSLTGINNAIYNIDSVRLGATYITASVAGSYYIDAFESRRQTYIGP